ncbi:hypothetical protein [Bdellovibrio sp.]|uniref:hypothetical protein n=1 Tax=Bdellovibrio sp. TaxID=28201 RepID=UPI0039E3AE7F
MKKSLLALLLLGLTSCTHLTPSYPEQRAPSSTPSDAALLEVKATEVIVFDDYFEPNIGSGPVFYAISKSSSLVAIFTCTGKKTRFGSDYFRTIATLKATKHFEWKEAEEISFVHLEGEGLCKRQIEDIREQLVKGKSVELNIRTGNIR